MKIFNLGQCPHCDNQVIDETEIPIIKLEGSDRWESGYRLGMKLEEVFPGQDGENFASALSEHPQELLQGKPIDKLLLVKQGSHDGPGWVWYVESGSKEYIVTGWCDYTGWDCQSDAKVFDISPW